jgi:Type II CAAX prenyl endopeptidase Rce1-like
LKRQTVLAGELSLVVAAMAAMLLVRREYFVPAAFGATLCMTGVWLFESRPGLPRPNPRALAAAAAAAAGLYAVFYLGNLGVTALHPFGIGPSAEQSIYSLIATPGNPILLQAALLVSDSVGYEGFFRGVVAARLRPRYGAKAVLIAAVADSCIHLLSFNPLWAATTLVADAAWGAAYLYGGLQASMPSHLLWDIAIFMVAPIR